MIIDDMTIEDFFDRLQDTIEQAIMGTGDTGKYQVKCVISTSDQDQCNRWLSEGCVFLNAYFDTENSKMMYVVGIKK